MSSSPIIISAFYPSCGVRGSSKRVGKVWVLAARQGFEPRYAAPEAAVLPLNERAITKLGFLATA